MKKLILAMCLFGSAAGAAEVPAPCDDKGDPRERCIAYKPGQIITLYAAPGATLTVEFPPTEKLFFSGVSDNQLIAGEGKPSERVQTGPDSTGDPNLMTWIPGAPDAPQQFFTIKPLRHLEPQPMLVLTWWTDPVSGRKELRRHSFELRTRPGELTEKVPDTFFSVRFTDATGDKAVRNARYQEARETRLARIAGARLQQVSSQHRNNAYDGQGTPEDIAALAPSAPPGQDAMWDDGERTYLRYPGNRTPPMAYEVTGKTEGVIGQSTQDDPETRGHLLVLNAVVRMLRLRDGDNVLCIVNRGFDPVGRNTGTGTVDPGVVRELRANVR